MPIRYQHVETVATTPDRAFAAIDDLPLTAKWLPPCVSLSKIGDGPNVPGDKLRYVFKQGGRQSEMAGEILARVLGERLHCKYSDSAFDVSVDLRVAPAPGGAPTTHYRTHRESYRAEQKLVTSADTIHVQLAPGGGACILLKPSP